MIQNKEKNTYALWLPSWYPNVLTPLNGDFIKRHAEAVSLYENIIVLHIQKDEKGAITKNIKETIHTTNSLTEIVVYYHPPKTHIKIADKLLSFIWYRRLYRKYIQQLIVKHGKPRLAHVHVAHKVAAIAVWVKRKYGLQLITSEHWSGYLKEARNGWKQLSIIEKHFLKRCFLDSSMVTAVSKYLGDALIEKMKIDSVEVVPNVVDTKIFSLKEPANNSPLQFIHISSGGPEKNIELIVEACSIIKGKGLDCKVWLVIPNRKSIEPIVTRWNLSENIVFLEEMPQRKLAEYIQSSDALILYSRYETFGCVVIESNACGIPAILSDLASFREYSVENKTALFAGVNDPNLLALQMSALIQNRVQLERKAIAKLTEEQFSCRTVGRQFQELYSRISP